ncbi:MAG TPA: sigma factor-like helix-turn-helix DNA-binding protein [Iamia sp.]|jgi:RNA polymerase sigma factor (sigma-70 family)|nr:sigma factor-like helix-turn-helix DNA-binding protein [Iamia sp.]
MTPTGPEELCDSIRDRLVGALTLATGDRAVGEELAQEALVRAWQRWAQVSRMDSPEAWTFRVGFNLAGSWRRRAAAERRAHRRRAGPATVHVDPDGAEVEAVRVAVAGLPPRQRAVIVARFYLGHDVAGTAALLDCAEGTVKAATAHALANLRRSGLVPDPIEEVTTL